MVCDDCNPEEELRELGIETMRKIKCDYCGKEGQKYSEVVYNRKLGKRVCYLCFPEVIGSE